jgi:hypothetical protein
VYPIAYLLAREAAMVHLLPELVIKEEQPQVGLVPHVPRADAQRTHTCRHPQINLFNNFVFKNKIKIL